MARVIKCLLCKCEDPGLDLQHPRSWVKLCRSDTVVLGVQEHPWDLITKKVEKWSILHRNC